MCVHMSSLRRRRDGLLLRSMERIHQLFDRIRVLHKPEREFHREPRQRLHSATGTLVRNLSAMFAIATRSA